MIKITIAIKNLGSDRPIKHNQLQLPKLVAPFSLRELLEALVRQQYAQSQIRSFYKKLSSKITVHNGNENMLELLTQTGKLGFGHVYDTKRDNVDAAIERVLLAYQDGLFVVFMDDSQVEEVDMMLEPQATTVFTFIRLTFLTGGFFNF